MATPDTACGGARTMFLLATAAFFVGPAPAQIQPPPPPDQVCDLISADLPPGQPPPPFDPARWSAYAPRAVTFPITIENPAGPIAPYVAGIQSNLAAACARWAQRLQGTASIEVLVRLGAVPRATGGSATSVFVATRNGFNIFEQGIAGEIRTGVDRNGADPDAIVTIGMDYLANELWFDPNPQTRTTPVPVDRTDAVSVFIHEMGHAIVFNGWRDNSNGSLPGNYQSTFDELTAFNGDFFFLGATAQASYVLPVPLTFGNAKHLANLAPRPGSDLLLDLMNGVVFYRGSRHDLSNPDVAINYDSGVHITAPCPSPQIATQPANRTSCAGSAASFTVAPIGSPPNVTYRWRHAGVDLAAGFTPWGSLVSGVSGPVLMISNLKAADAGTYDCIVGDNCGRVFSNAATLTVTPFTCDLNEDGAVDFGDVFSLIDTVGGVSPCLCTCDLSDDGAVDFTDVFLLIDIVGGLMPCL